MAGSLIEGAKLVASGSSCCNSSEHIVDAYGCFFSPVMCFAGSSCHCVP